MSLRLLGDDIAVIPIEDELRTKSGLYLAQQTRQRVDQGIVKYRGPASVDVRVGDHVLFSGYSGTKVSVEDEGILIIMAETDLHAMFEDDGQGLMFPKIVLDRLLTEAEGEAQAKSGLREETVAYMFEVIRSKFDDYVREKGLEF